MSQPDLFGYEPPAPVLPPVITGSPLPYFSGPVTPDSIMTFGRYKDRPLKEVPYDYLLDLFIWNRSGDLLEYIEQLIDQTKGNYKNLVYHKSEEWI